MALGSKSLKVRSGFKEGDVVLKVQAGCESVMPGPDGRGRDTEYQRSQDTLVSVMVTAVLPPSLSVCCQSHQNVDDHLKPVQKNRIYPR